MREGEMGPSADDRRRVKLILIAVDAIECIARSEWVVVSETRQLEADEEVQ
jgi:hypothetical protein